MTMAAEIKNRMGPAPTPGDKQANVKINTSTPVKQGGGGCCQDFIYNFSACFDEYILCMYI